MEVLESIISYVNHMKRESKLYTDQKDALGMLYKYCNHVEPGMNLCEIERDFFQEFLIYWLPKNQKRLEEKEICQVLQSIQDYCVYIQETYNIATFKENELLKAYKQECLRIYQLKHLFAKYLCDPVISTTPLVIDLITYKKHKARHNTRERQGTYQQGLFQVIEIDYDYTVVLRKLPQGCLVRVMLADYLAGYMKKGDILHLRIKQKQFFSCWEVVDLRNYYLPDASQYLT